MLVISKRLEVGKIARNSSVNRTYLKSFLIKFFPLSFITGVSPSFIGFPESRFVFIRSDSAAASKTDLVAEPLGHFRSLFINR